MSKAIQSFIKVNQAAYAKARVVFKAIEAQDWATTLAEAGIVGTDIRVYATIYVAEASGVTPKANRFGTMSFKCGSKEHNRVNYLVAVASGKRESYKAKSKTKPESHGRLTPAVRNAARAYLAQFDSVSEAIAALKAVA